MVQGISGGDYLNKKVLQNIDLVGQMKSSGVSPHSPEGSESIFTKMQLDGGANPNFNKNVINRQGSSIGEMLANGSFGTDNRKKEDAQSTMLLLAGMQNANTNPNQSFVTPDDYANYKNQNVGADKDGASNPFEMNNSTPGITEKQAERKVNQNVTIMGWTPSQDNNNGTATINKNSAESMFETAQFDNGKDSDFYMGAIQKQKDALTEKLSDASLPEEERKKAEMMLSFLSNVEKANTDGDKKVSKEEFNEFMEDKEGLDLNTKDKRKIRAEVSENVTEMGKLDSENLKDNGNGTSTLSADAASSMFNSNQLDNAKDPSFYMGVINDQIAEIKDRMSNTSISDEEKKSLAASLSFLSTVQQANANGDNKVERGEFDAFMADKQNGLTLQTTAEGATQQDENNPFKKYEKPMAMAS